MIALAKAHDSSVLLATWAHCPCFNDYASTEHYQYGFSEMNSVVRSVADREAVAMFDIAKIMYKDKRFWSDGRHLNERGAAEKARLFAKFLIEQEPDSSRPYRADA